MRNEMLAVLLASALVAGCTTHESERATTTFSPAENFEEAHEAQGNYTGVLEGTKVGGKVTALKDGTFDLVVYPGGLPRHGWDGDKKKLIKGNGRPIPVDQRRVSEGLLQTIMFELDNGMQGSLLIRQADQGHQDSDAKRYPNRVLLIEGKGGKDLGGLVSPQEKEFLRKLMDQSLKR